mmetsp:Transcript_62414/g.188372  ORF Transcript_62414/g.188372 Transcript_62414/m.188372 type:complete len:282 (+) Transcript_62414:158-1003(+)
MAPACGSRPWTRAARPPTKTRSPLFGPAGLLPRRSTMKRIGVPLAFSASLAAAMAASIASWLATGPGPTATMQSPARQPIFSASGLVNFVTTRFSIRSPSVRSSPKSSPTTMATLCVAKVPMVFSLLSSPVRKSKAPRTPPAMPCTASPTKSVTMSTASAMPSPTVPAMPFSAKSSAVPLMPSSMVVTTPETLSPTRSTASSAASASWPSASCVTPRVSVMRPMPPNAAPPTNFVASPTARPASSRRLPSSSCLRSTTEEGAACFAARSHSAGFSPRSTAA